MTEVISHRMPAEWETQQATILSWPHNVGTWPYQLPEVIQTCLKLIKEIFETQEVWLNVGSSQMKTEVLRLITLHGVSEKNVRFLDVATHDAWVRDYGPIYVKKNENGRESRLATNWRFNGWGNKYDDGYFSDGEVNRKIVKITGDDSCDIDFILEGGSIEVNGCGTLLTTKDCLLNSNRNSASQSNIEAQLKKYLGVKKILWFDAKLAGDDTDGHIDNVVRFVNPRTVVCAWERSSADENYSSLLAIYQKLQTMTDQDGLPLQIVQLPMPNRVEFKNKRLPASYANFLVINGKVLVPTYRSPETDQIALATLQALFPQRKIVGIDCRDLVWGLGSIHCISQQVPK